MGNEPHQDVLDKFGSFFVEQVRDRAFRQYKMLEEGLLRSPQIVDLQDALAQLPGESKNIVRECVRDAIDGVAHDLLAAFQEFHDLEKGIELFADGVNVAEASGMLHGELFGPDGWIARFSQYPTKL